MNFKNSSEKNLLYIVGFFGDRIFVVGFGGFWGILRGDFLLGFAQQSFLLDIFVCFVTEIWYENRRDESDFEQSADYKY